MNTLWNKLWQEVDCIGFDNSDPPQLWAWINGGDKGVHSHETAEVLFRVDSFKIVKLIQSQQAEIKKLKEDIKNL